MNAPEPDSFAQSAILLHSSSVRTVTIGVLCMLIISTYPLVSVVQVQVGYSSRVDERSASHISAQAKRIESLANKIPVSPHW